MAVLSIKSETKQKIRISNSRISLVQYDINNFQTKKKTMYYFCTLE